MSNTPKILVAAEASADAQTVADILKNTDYSLSLSVDSARAASDFDALKPSIVILAFRNIDHAVRYYLNLYRTSREIHEAHSTVLLCTKERVNEAYRLCHEQQFDDYVVFWPIFDDSKRLFMAIENQLRFLNCKAETNLAAEIRENINAVSKLAPTLRENLTEHVCQVSSAIDHIDSASAGIDDRLTRMRDRVLHDGIGGALEVRNHEHVRAVFDQVRMEEVRPQLDAMRQGLNVVQQRAQTLKRDADSHLGLIQEAFTAANSEGVPILLVDDDGFQCKLLTQALAGRGFVIRYVATGERALSLLRQERPALVLMDYQLPDVDGITLTRRFRQEDGCSNLPIIMITGASEKQVVIESLKAGASDFVVKPINREALLQKIQRLIQTPPWV